MGDFNEVLSLDDVKDGFLSRPKGMRDFQDCVATLNHEDLRAVGSQFSWWDSNSDNPKYKKLDRVLVNNTWTSAFNGSFANFLPRDVSDHSLVVVHMRLSVPEILKHFQFFNHLILLEGFKEVVSKVLSRFWVSFGSPCE